MAKKSKKSKSEYLQVRIDPELKEKAEKVFEKLGISTSQAIKLFLNQVTMNNGLPFDLYVREEKSFYLTEDEEVDLSESLRDFKEGRYKVWDGKGKNDLKWFFDTWQV